MYASGCPIKSEELREVPTVARQGWRSFNQARRAFDLAEELRLSPWDLENAVGCLGNINQMEDLWGVE